MDHNHILKELKLKATPKRLAILDILYHASIYLSPDEVWTQMKERFRTIGLPTVYRNLEELAGRGIISKVIHPDRKLYYFSLRQQGTPPSFRLHLLQESERSQFLRLRGDPEGGLADLECNRIVSHHAGLRDLQQLFGKQGGGAMKTLRPAICALLAALLLTAVSCGPDRKDVSGGPGKIVVVTTLFPLYDFTRTIAGDRATVTLILPPGVEAHTFEPKPGDMARVDSAQLFVYTGRYMEPWSEELLKGVANQSLITVDASRASG
jgi:Fe2+ or Zn2+ uptake regulation protein